MQTHAHIEAIEAYQLLARIVHAKTRNQRVALALSRMRKNELPRQDNSKGLITFRLVTIIGDGESPADATQLRNCRTRKRTIGMLPSPAHPHPRDDRPNQRTLKKKRQRQTPIDGTQAYKLLARVVHAKTHNGKQNQMESNATKKTNSHRSYKRRSSSHE